jgi:hypothetical protein
MRVVNRTAISLIGETPFVKWMNSNDADAAKGTITVARAKPYGTVVLLPEFELEEDIQEWVEDNASWLFEFQLASWTDDESLWPSNRDLRMFREWFRVDIHSVVVDAGEDDIDGEEL